LPTAAPDRPGCEAPFWMVVCLVLSLVCYEIRWRDIPLPRRGKGEALALKHDALAPTTG
jgi:hypothetical protein